jgi:hypothetical protein
MLMRVCYEGGVEFAQIVVAEVEELGGELDAGGW